jgi:hypothetical protein
VSIYGKVGLTVKVSDPLWYSIRGYERTYTVELDDWSHEIAVDGGYKSAQFSLKVSAVEIGDWLENGLGQHVELFDIGGIKRWAGVVNRVNAAIGTLSIGRGPLMGISNRVLVTYTPYIDVTVDPPVTGTATETPLANDTTSQARYSILEGVVAGGQLMDATTVTGGTAANEALEVRDAYLKEYKNPETSQALNVQASSEPQISVECVGYEAFLDKYIYTSAATGYTTVPAKMQTILGLQPNALFSSDYTKIQAAADFLLLTPNTEDGNKTARQVLTEMIAQGTGADNRTFLMVLNDRVVTYDQVPSTVEYSHRLYENTANIFSTSDGAPVKPWEVLPARWLIVSDFLAGRILPSELRLDPRCIFIENVSYKAPYDLTVTGSRVTKAKQMLAKFGVSA